MILYENLSPLLEAVYKEGSVTLNKASIMNFRSCVKYAILLTGDTSAQISTVHREQVLTKLNPMLTSLAKEEFPDAHLQLFGTGFEQQLKPCFETADTISKAERAFEEGHPGDYQGPKETANSSEASSHSKLSNS